MLTVHFDYSNFYFGSHFFLAETRRRQDNKKDCSILSYFFRIMARPPINKYINYEVSNVISKK